MALTVVAQGKYDEAKPLYDRAIAIGEKTLGPDHPDLAAKLNNLAVSLSDQGQHEEALEYSKRAVEIFERRLGSGHSHTKIARDVYHDIESKCTK